MARYIFTVPTQGKTGRPIQLLFYDKPTGGHRITDISTVTSGDVGDPIPNGVLVLDAAGATTKIVGPEGRDLMYMYVHGTGGARTALTAASEPGEFGPSSAPRHYGPAFMVLATTSLAAMQQAAANGATHAHVQAFWDQSQTAAGGPVDATVVLQSIADAKTAGLKVALEVALQYPPTFVQSGVPQFKNQTGALHGPAQNTGNNVRDWVWSATGRNYVKDFLAKLFTQINWGDIERVRLGGLTSGELQFPSPAASPVISWWGFSAPAQTGTDLYPGMAKAPVAAVFPTAANTSTGASVGYTDQDETFVTWYQSSLINWMTWYIAQHRKWFSGPIYVMHPGFGLRKNSQTPTSTTQAQNWQTQVSQGLDWNASIAAYPDPLCYPYSTWIDGAPGYAPAAYSDVNDGNGAPWYHLYKVAKQLGRAGHLWGENTGGQSNTEMNAVFQSGAVAFGYEGVAWLNHANLAAGTNGGTYANFSARVAELKNTY